MMTKCPNEYCTYPDCDMSCEMELEDLLESVAKENEELREVIESLQNSLWAIRRETSKHMYEREYKTTCPYGYADCINDPAYQKKYYFENWDEDGRPTECDYAQNHYANSSSCPYYDDEDK